MVRFLAVGSVLLFAQALPVSAETIALECTGSSGATHITFDLDAHTVTTGDNQKYPIQITGAFVQWNSKTGVPGETFRNMYIRDSATLNIHVPGGDYGGVITSAGTYSYKCVRGQKVF
jgi:hypothetical protein